HRRAVRLKGRTPIGGQYCAPKHTRQSQYKWRNQIERLFNKLKNWRRVATRYDKTRESYLGFVAIAAVKLWIPFVHER
ncbi:transposase, partial [Bosea vestrisii]